MMGPTGNICGYGSFPPLNHERLLEPDTGNFKKQKNTLKNVPTQRPETNKKKQVFEGEKSVIFETQLHMGVSKK